VIIESNPSPQCPNLHFRCAQAHWEKHQYYALRQTIFCEEQGIFSDTDRDDRDPDALPIVAIHDRVIMNGDVVGVVRIDERSPGVWWGSRLGVESSYRSMTDFTPREVFEDRDSPVRFSSVGAILIYKAVSTAQALGCRKFLAHVQQQNVPLFRWLHWHSVEEVTLHDRPHHRMEADLSHYPASEVLHGLDRQPA
jgi:hypothetical protein